MTVIIVKFIAVVISVIRLRILFIRENGAEMQILRKITNYNIIFTLKGILCILLGNLVYTIRINYVFMGQVSHLTEQCF